MTAIQTIRKELADVQVAQSECVTETGYVRPDSRYRYQTLIDIAGNLKKSLDYLQEKTERN